MGFYNMEGSMLVSHSNPLIMVQQYLLTEDEKFLTDRTIPTLAYILSRGSAHFAYDTSIGSMTSNYAGTDGPSALRTTPTNYGTNVYSALYEMTQGRVPFFLDYALRKVNNGYDAAGLLSSTAMYQIAVENGNDELAASIAKSIVSQTDSYMTTAVPFQMDSGIVNSFRTLGSHHFMKNWKPSCPGCPTSGKTIKFQIPMRTRSAILTNERQVSNTRPAVLGASGRLLSAYANHATGVPKGGSLAASFGEHFITKPRPY